MMVLGAMVLLGMVVYLFSTMGGEFIPKLQKGDFALEVRISPGTSLQEMKKSMGYGIFPG